MPSSELGTPFNEEVEHLRRLERFTAGDSALRERRLAFHLGPESPIVRRYVAEPMTLRG